MGSFLIVSLHAGFYSANVVAKSIIHTILLVVLVSFHPSYLGKLYALAAADLVCLGIPVVYFRDRIVQYVKDALPADMRRDLIAQMRVGFIVLSKELISVFQVHLSRIIVSAHLLIAVLGLFIVSVEEGLYPADDRDVLGESGAPA